MKKFSDELVVMLEVLKERFDSENKIFQYVCKDDKIAYGHDLATTLLLDTIEELLKADTQD